MKALFCGFMALGLFGLGMPATAAPDKVRITSQKKLDDVDKGHVGRAGSRDKNSEKVVYNLTVQNQSLGDLSQLTVDYVLFIERQKLGEKIGGEEHVDRVTGTKTIELLTNRAPQTITTEEMQLNNSNLVGTYHYKNGGRIKAEDIVVGVWVRVTQNGELIGEYTNPPTVTKRGWDKK